MEEVVKYWNSLPREVVDILSTHKHYECEALMVRRMLECLHRNHLFLCVNLMNKNLCGFDVLLFFDGSVRYSVLTHWTSGTTFSSLGQHQFSA